MNPEYESPVSSKTGSNHAAKKDPAVDPIFASNDANAAVAESSSRRKRSFVRRQQRRGGESHMTLFKAAALASMASPGGCDDSDDDVPIANQQRLSLLLPIAPPVPELGDQSDSEESCRKRIRRPSPNYLSVIEQTSSILGDLRVAARQPSFDEVTTKDEDMTPLCQVLNHLKKG